MSRPRMEGHEPRRRFGPQQRAKPKPDDGRPKCSFCTSPVRWAFPAIPAGTRKVPAYATKPKPFDWEPDANGRFSLYEQGDKTIYVEMTRSKAAAFRAGGNPTYTAHFGNCSKKSEWGQRGQAYGTGSVTR